MEVEIKQGDVLEQGADVLICSLNIYLNLSGGVGGEILRRHGGWADLFPAARGRDHIHALNLRQYRETAKSSNPQQPEYPAAVIL
jgi:O-acetyl-ADP-ribose deacetylase (regulator of RNase III)